MLFLEQRLALTGGNPEQDQGGWSLLLKERRRIKAMMDQNELEEQT